ncbi:hypothetical protein AB0J35_34800 [Nonomuraea angiospora]|uniref:hypothetical protein n=1 Tax=Nonomuraea angiospora TaxID=46172 RepID=UPI003419EF8F
MNGFLGEIGKKLAERWVTLLALPGLLYLAAAVVGHILGWTHALDLALLSNRIDQWAASSSLHSVGGTVLIIILALAGSVAAGLVAAALGRSVSSMWMLPGKRPPVSWIADYRRGRSRAAKRAADASDAGPNQVLAAIDRADRICLVEADRPTWIGDRLRACRVRVERAYGLDIDVIWPRLWLLLPDSARAEITSARDAYMASARLMGWALLYFLLTVWWWPAALIASVIGVTAQFRARDATTVLADLLEAAVDLYGRELATQLGHPKFDKPLSLNEGQAITALARKSRWDPASPLAD